MLGAIWRARHFVTHHSHSADRYSKDIKRWLSLYKYIAKLKSLFPIIINPIILLSIIIIICHGAATHIILILSAIFSKATTHIYLIIL